MGNPVVEVAPRVSFLPNVTMMRCLLLCPLLAATTNTAAQVWKEIISVTKKIESKMFRSWVGQLRLHEARLAF